MDDYLAKPIQARALVKALENYLTKSQSLPPANVRIAATGDESSTPCRFGSGGHGPRVGLGLSGIGAAGN